MTGIEGKKPKSEDGAPERRKYLIDKLAEVRKSCETIAGFSLANIVITTLRAPPGSGSGTSGKHVAFILGLLGFSIGFFGASLSLPRNVNEDQLEGALSSALRVRSRFRLVAAIMLLAGVLWLVHDVW
jgi:hypothetical protein